MVNTSFFIILNFEYITGACKATLAIIFKKKIWNNCSKLETGVFRPNYKRGGIYEYECIKRAIRICNFQVKLKGVKTLIT